MSSTSWKRQVLCMVLCAALILSGCAVPQGGSQSMSPANSAKISQAGCILGHMATGALTTVVLGGLVTGSMVNAGRNAAVGAIAGFAVAWMRCINQFATPTTTKVANLEDAGERGYTPQQGTILRLRSGYLDPSAISGGSQSAVKVAYLVMDSEREVTVNQKISFRFLLPDGTELSSEPKIDRVVVEPGLHVVSLPIEIPREITDGKLVVSVDLDVKGRTERFSQELVITSQTRILEAARTNAARQGAEFAQVLAGAGKGGTPTTSSAEVQIARADIASGSGSKSAASGQKTLTINIARANVRDQPSAKGKILRTAAKGEKLRVEREITGSEGRWLLVNTAGTEGWVGASSGSVE